MTEGNGLRRIARLCPLAGFWLALSAPVHAQEPAPSPADPNLERLKVCVSNHRQSQVKRNEGDLLAARTALLACSQSECPAIVRKDCSQWFGEVDRDVPSVVVTVRAGANDVEATLYVDGNEQPPEIFSRALELNPGRHHFRIQPSKGPSQERDLVLAPREKARSLSFEIAPVGAAAPAAAAAPSRSLPLERPVPLVSYVLGGAAIALAAGGGVLGALALSDRAELAEPITQGGCSPYCSDDQVSSTKSKAIVADVLLGASVVAGATALVTYLLRPEKPRESADTTLDVTAGAAPGQGFLGLRGSF
jgi:hypothetical protein